MERLSNPAPWFRLSGALGCILDLVTLSFWPVSGVNLIILSSPLCIFSFILTQFARICVVQNGEECQVRL